jgi:hypothetical protein
MLLITTSIHLSIIRHVSDITPATPLLDQPPPGKTAIADKLRC